MVLVTGATGMVGGNLLWHLLQTKTRVKAVRRSEHSVQALRKIFRFYTATPDFYLEQIEWVYADVLVPDSLEAAMMNVDCVYHCAAVVDLGKNGSELTETNVAGTRNVVQAALKANVKSFCFVSSIAACGNEPGTGLITEESPFSATTRQSMYARSKFLSEQEVWAGIAAGLPAVIVNPGVILGVSGNDGGSARLFSQIEKGMPFYTLGGTGYVDVRDVVQIMIRLSALSITGERYILVSENCCNKDVMHHIATGLNKKPPFINAGKTLLSTAAFLFELFGKITGKHPVIDRSTARTALGRKYYSSDKIRSLLNIDFIPIEQSISDICTCLKTKNPDRE